MGKTEPTIKDVAKLANVSIGTVDRVLHKRGRVSKENIELVNAAVEKLHYRPSQIAKALAARKHSIKIGITYPLVEKEFWSEITEGIKRAERELRPFGVQLVTDHYSSYSADEQMASVNRLIAAGVNGIALSPSGSTEHLEEVSRSIPVATVIDNIRLDGKAFHIGPDDRKIGRLAAKLTSLYICSKGKIAILRPLTPADGMRVRVGGFKEKINEDCPGIKIAYTSAITGVGERDYYINAYAKTLEAIKRVPDLKAIYISNGLTEWIAKAVEDTGNKGKIAVIGHEYTSGVEHFLKNGIIGATIYQNPSQQFYLACKLLYGLLAGENRLPWGKNIVTNCSIIMDETFPFSRYSGFEYL